MDSLEQFLTLPVILLCLLIWFLASAPKLTLELVYSKIKLFKTYNKISFLWDEFIPPFIGMLFGLFIISYPFPDSIKDSSSGKIVCGVICGLAAGPAHRILFEILRKVLADKFGVNIPENIPLTANTTTETTS